jgi:hypothetical protein
VENFVFLSDSRAFPLDWQKVSQILFRVREQVLRGYCLVSAFIRGLGILFVVFLAQITCASAMPYDANGASETAKETSTLQTQTQSQIGILFNNLEAIGAAYNSGGSKDASIAAFETGCQAGISAILNSKTFAELSSEYMPAPAPDGQIGTNISSFVRSTLGDIGRGAVAAACSALRTHEDQSNSISSLALSSSAKAKNDLTHMLTRMSVDSARNSGLPFLSRLEIELGVSEGDFVSSITTVQPIWEDAANRHHVFTQLSWYKAPDDRDEEGFKVKHDTFNAGLAYRYLTQDAKKLFGANIFFDHAPHSNHNRMSLGVDARTSQMAFSANRYMPLSTWKDLDLFYEEKAAAGWDLTLRGQIPELPSWTASVQGYEWDNQKNGENLYGALANLEYSPVPALAFRVGVREESQESPSLEAAIRFAWRFDQPEALQLRPRTELAPVSDYVYEKVQRENIIRVQKRRQASSKLTVIATTGVNTAIEASGASSLQVGQTLLMPVTVTTENAGGAFARLRFADGATLTAGQNTQVLIEPDLITLIFGTIQYVSGGTIHNIVVPGGTIILHGTDIDIVSDGTDSSVRVRDGSVTFTGSVAGSATIGAEQMAESVVGIVNSVAAGAPDYIAHTDQVSAQIDRIAPPLEGVKVAPYPYEAPRIVTETLVPGQVMEIGLKFNDAVTVSGGTPRLTLTIGGNNRTADFISGSGTDDLLFGYTVQASDGGENSLTVTGLDKNGATVMGNGKDAVTTIADTVLTFSGSVNDVVAPAGYAATFTTDPINNANKTAAAFDITSAEVGSTYDYAITSSGGAGSVTGSGTVSGATESVSGIDVSALPDGVLTVSVTLTDTSSNVGGAVTDTVTKDVAPPTIVSVIAPANGTYAP